MCLIPEHNFNSDGYCKNCNTPEVKCNDPYCDLDEIIEFWIDEANPAYRPNIAGYLAGIQYMASIRKYSYQGL